MDLHKVALLNQYLLRNTDGSKFFGQFLDIPNTTRVSNFNSARRLLRVKPKCRIKASETFYDPDGRVYLTAEHGGQFLDGNPLFTHYKLFEMESTKVQVSRKSATTIHSVSHQTIDGVLTPLETIYIGHEIRSTSSDTLGVNIKRQQIITGFDIQVEDIVDIHGKLAVVELVNDQIGVKIAHIKYK